MTGLDSMWRYLDAGEAPESVPCLLALRLCRSQLSDEDLSVSLLESATQLHCPDTECLASGGCRGLSRDMPRHTRCVLPEAVIVDERNLLERHSAHERHDAVLTMHEALERDNNRLIERLSSDS